MMTEETLEAIIKKALSFSSGNCTFGFQGGEPTLAGLDFFKTVVSLQKTYNRNNISIKNTVQTNGLLIDDEWAAFFAENGFLIGVSIDGNADLHDLYRRDATGNGTFSKVMKCVETLNRHNVDFNVLTVVTSETARKIKDVYRFFLENGLVYQQYIPCLDPIGEPRGRHAYSLMPGLYARFLKKLFDLWYIDLTEGRFVYIRYFENLAGILLGLNAESCDMNGTCAVQYAIEADGSVYPCDFYMLEEYQIGNINTDSINTIDQNRERIGFIQKYAQLPEKCQNCQWLKLCRNGCRRNRNTSGLNDYCSAYQEFFPYMLPRMQKLLDKRCGQRSGAQ
jgi:uncharacterized protein